MKISYLSTSQFPSLSANSQQVAQMCQALAELGHTVTLVRPADAGSEQFGGEELRSGYGVRGQIEVRSPRRAPWGWGYAYGLRAVRHARLAGSDLAYTRDVPIAVMAVLAGLRTVLELHEPPRRMGRLRRWCLRQLLRAPGNRLTLVAISSALADRIRADLPALKASKIPLLIEHDGVDLGRFERALTEPPALTLTHLAAPRALYAGHLYAGRGIELVLELAARPELRQVSFVIAGGAPTDVERVKRTCHERALRNVHLIGHQPGSTLPGLYRQAQVLLMPYQRSVAISGGGNSVEWMSPLKMFEYLAAGVPMISSDLPVLREVLDPSVAALCPPDDADAWARALQALIADTRLAQAQAARARALVSHYDWKARADRILKSLGSPLAHSLVSSEP